ncbi:MAG: hypothetical protein RLZZ511_2856 [Cyanobacteriota bacterium]
MGVSGINSRVSRIWGEWVSRLLRRGRSVVLMLMLTVGLTGCLDADTQIQVASPHRGQIVQHIELGSQLAAAQGWLNQLETQARKLNGSVSRTARNELTLTVPFTNAIDLETKFNQLFTPPNNAASDLPPIAAKLQVQTSNLLLLQRDKLIYDIDLTALGLQADDGEVLLNAGNGLDMKFGVQGPWGVGGRDRQQSNGETFWNLQAGQKNHVEATLWMPSPIGLGTAAIVGLGTAATYYERRRQS